MVERIQNEPVLTLALVQAMIALAVAFGLDITAEQVGMTVAATAAILSWIAREQVTPLGPQE